jgi:predicted dithiol-disulfide oxidoreductase (DUF899 family)
MEIEEATVEARIEAIEKEIAENLVRLNALKKSLHGDRVEDYLLHGAEGEVCLSELFGEKDDLIVVHNMGARCSYCTMWADGFNGVYEHLRDRASFVVVSPDMPEQQAEFAASRGWRFRMISDSGSTFTEDMGFRTAGDDGRTSVSPGYTTFRRHADGTITRVGNDMFGPGDRYSSPWHMFDMLAESGTSWHPKLDYGR